MKKSKTFLVCATLSGSVLFHHASVLSDYGMFERLVIKGSKQQVLQRTYTFSLSILSLFMKLLIWRMYWF